MGGTETYVSSTVLPEPGTYSKLDKYYLIRKGYDYPYINVLE